MSPIPEDFTEEEVVTHVVGKKQLLGKVWKDNKTGEYVRYRCYSYGVEYKIGDAVYIESQRAEQPFYVCCIQEFKMTKRDSLMVHFKWFYRTNEIPEQMYQLLSQERHMENKVFHKQLQMAEKAAAIANGLGESYKPMMRRKKLNDQMLRTRELFESTTTDIHPCSVLRGKCTVYHCQDIKSVRDFTPLEDTFFFMLAYNPETRRLASTQGEIRVGASHQADCPECTPDVPIEERPEPEEELTWEPGRIHDHDLLMFLRAGRSMAAFAAMCDGESPDDGFKIASKDGIAATAIQLLHDNKYNTGEALQSLLKAPYSDYGNADPVRSWPEEDVKEFVKGLRIYGKNFFMIRQECLPYRETSELVEFYYLWKKSPGAAQNRPRGLKRVKGASKAGKSNRNEDDPDDLSSCSEDADDMDEDDNANNGSSEELSPYYCRHCYTTNSSNWHHAGTQKLLVCIECRVFFKKYSEFPCLEPARPNVNDEEDITSSEDEAAKQSAKVDQDSSAKESTGGASGSAAAMEPIEIKNDLPKSISLVSPVPQMPSSGGSGVVPNLGPHALPPTGSAHPGIPGLPAGGLIPGLPPPPQAHLQGRPGMLPEPARAPSPPPKPDGSECHRSQSAIFIRQWNRGEGSSCSRTDLFFKPVPDSTLARKREERLRKAKEREELKAAQNAQAHHAATAAKVPRLDLGNPFDPFRHGNPSSAGPAAPGLPGLPGMLPPGPGMAELERLDRERAASFMAAAMAANPRPALPGAAGSPFPPGFPPPGLSMEDMVRSAERQYLDQLALSADPLVRLQMAGINPEIPGAPSPLSAAYSGLLRPPAPPPGLDPRFRLPPVDLLHPPRPPPGFSLPSSATSRLPPPPPTAASGNAAGLDLVQRQLLLEREASLRQASAQQHLVAQQEEFLRNIEHEARARAAQQRP